ncbi:hypothetical protein ZIOFF_075909 [Zingiber officinale]|uniref:Uncharacterized protein n=1 Tax=Zingiber officinale TaxID=94328 RepID=A0A8J5C3W4_ZINOF|nr:hypothetical protein ZIOFF_075909 [Zingiber officinale]
MLPSTICKQAKVEVDLDSGVVRRGKRNLRQLDTYIYDYLVRRNLLTTAEIFKEEGNVVTEALGIQNSIEEETNRRETKEEKKEQNLENNLPDNILSDWWSIFSDVFIARTNEDHSPVDSSLKGIHGTKAKDHQEQLQMQHLQIIPQEQTQLQQQGGIHPALIEMINATNTNEIPKTSLLDSKTYEEGVDQPQLMADTISTQFLDANRDTLLQSAAIHPGQLIQYNHINGSSDMQHIQGQNQYTPLHHSKGEASSSQRPLNVDPSTPQRSLNVDPSLFGRGILGAKSRTNGAGCLTVYHSKSGRPRKSTSSGAGYNSRTGTTATLSVTPPLSTPIIATASGASMANNLQNSNATFKSSTETLSITPPPSTPSHISGSGVSMDSNLQNSNAISKSLMMHGTDRTYGLAYFNQMDDCETFEDIIESFFSNSEDGREIFATTNMTTAHDTKSLNGVTLTESGHAHTSQSIVSCHFSSDGMWLASVGHDKKVIIWNMETLQTISSSDEHSKFATGVCFSPNSTLLASSSFDKTLRLWNASEVWCYSSYNLLLYFSSVNCLHTFSGHNAPVTSLDFHPQKSDLLCSCGNNRDIRYWSASHFLCTRSFMGATVGVKFQPRSGLFLAAAADNGITIFDAETTIRLHILQGHNKIESICWAANGDTLASVSKDMVKVWCLRTGSCIHEHKSKGERFSSCVFHPQSPQILVLGGNKTLKLWDVTENKSFTVPAHEDLVSSLAQSESTGLIASSSYDKSIKVWR